MIFVHIGMAKAGSSHLQHFLAANQEQLATRGVHYPTVSRQGVAHHPLSRSLATSAGITCTEWTAMRGYLEAHREDKVVISSEGFEAIDASHLRTALTGFDVTIICYVRETVLRLPSHYSQNTKLGLNVDDFDRFFDLMNVTQHRKWLYGKLLQQWAAAFGAHNIRARSLDPGVLHEGDMVADFLSVLGLTKVGLEEPAVAGMNESPAWQLLEALRDLHAETVGGSLSPTAKIADPVVWPHLRRTLERGHEAAAALGWTERGRYLSAEQNELLCELYDRQVDLIESLGIDARVRRLDLDRSRNRAFLPTVDQIPLSQVASFRGKLAPIIEQAPRIGVWTEGAGMTKTAATTTRDALTRLAPWHFNIEVEPGLWTKDCNRPEYDNVDHNSVGVIDPREMVPLLEAILPNGLTDKTFLDVGCNGGGYCFVAHELGARRAHGFDVREHWIRQAEFIKSVRYPDAQGIEFQVADAKTFRHAGRFDVTLFKGVFYHLPDPISVLRDICDLTERAIIVDSVGRSDIPESAMIPWNESTTHVMSGVDGLAWFPGGPAAMRAILEWAGFPHMRVVEWKHGTPETRNRSRFRVFATRDARDQADYVGPEYKPVQPRT